MFQRILSPKNPLIVFLVQTKSLFHPPCHTCYQPKLLVRCPTNKSLFGYTLMCENQINAHTVHGSRRIHENKEKRTRKEKINVCCVRGDSTSKARILKINVRIEYITNHNQFSVHNFFVINVKRYWKTQEVTIRPKKDNYRCLIRLSCIFSERKTNYRFSRAKLWITGKKLNTVIMVDSISIIF